LGKLSIYHSQDRSGSIRGLLTSYLAFIVESGLSFTSSDFLISNSPSSTLAARQKSPI
jgi:hypothetical protein